MLGDIFKLFIYIPNCSFSSASPPSYSLSTPSSIHTYSLLREEEISHGDQTISPVRAKDLKAVNELRDSPGSSLGIAHEDPIRNCYIRVGGLGMSHPCSQVGSSVSMDPVVPG